MAAIVFTRKPRKMPSLSSASSASVTLSRACASREERFGARRNPFHRPAGELGGEQHQRHFVEDRRLHAERAAGVAGDDADLALRHFHHLGEVGARRVRALDRGVERVAAVGGVVVADRAARLHRRRGDAVDDEFLLDDMVGLGEGGVGRGLVADQFDEADIVGRVIPHLRARRASAAVFGRGDRRQRLVLDLDQFGGIERLRHGLGDDEGDAIADPAHAVLGQDRIARLEHRRAVAPLEAAMASAGRPSRPP